MNKRICDRCGKEIENETLLSAIGRNMCTHLYLKQLGPAIDCDLDLCDGCEIELSAWLRKDNKGCGCSDCAKEVASLNEKIKQLEKENEMLKNSTVKEIIENMDVEISVSIKKKEE